MSIPLTTLLLVVSRIEILHAVCFLVVIIRMLDVEVGSTIVAILVTLRCICRHVPAHLHLVFIHCTSLFLCCMDLALLSCANDHIFT